MEGIDDGDGARNLQDKGRNIAAAEWAHLSKKKAKKVTNTGLQLKSTAATDEPA